MKNEVNRAFVAKKKHVLTLILATLLPLSLLAQGGITEPGATEPNSLATTTFDNPTGPNHAPAGGPNRTIINTGDPGDADKSPIGAPWILLGFAAAYAGYRLVRRKEVKE